jgi:hypothetical protein
LSTSLSPVQRRQVTTFAQTLDANDTVTCVGGAGTGPLRVLRDLARARATAVCMLLAQRVPGVRTEVNIALSGEVQVVYPMQPSQAGGHTPVREQHAHGSGTGARKIAQHTQRARTCTTDAGDPVVRIERLGKRRDLSALCRRERC